MIDHRKLDGATEALKRASWAAWLAVQYPHGHAIPCDAEMKAAEAEIKGASWQGRVCGTYSASLTPEGYCVESERETGSVQVYPAAALERVPGDTDG